MYSQDKPLTNLQLELLKIFNIELNDQQLQEIKALLTRYFADKASGEADRLWEEKGWTNETMGEWLQEED
jgi:hypothetical protein